MFINLKNGFSELEIMNKTKSLKGVLDSFSSKGNESMLKSAGFVDTTSIAQWNNFKGWLSIK